MTQWTVSHATTEEDWTRQYLSSILTQPCASAASQAEAHHRELDPGVAHVWATGGSLEDRRLAEQSLVARLAQRGIERAVFTFDPEHKTADWNDIMNKARRLIDSGHVHMVRNGYNNIVSHVWGDHGDYDVEIGRDDPNSRAITSWTCDCPWDQFAWQRTRQWKKYEGRPCAHVLATFWQSQMLPIDEEGTPGMNALKTSPDQMQLPFQFGPTDMPADPGAPVQKVQQSHRVYSTTPKDNRLLPLVHHSQPLPVSYLPSLVNRCSWCLLVKRQWANPSFPAPQCLCRVLVSRHRLTRRRIPRPIRR
jgi:hypothetical protein